MNEKIQKLLQKCYHARIDRDTGETITLLSVDQQKFAELIIQECLTICGAIQGLGEVSNMHEFASGAAQCKAIIKRDFGIK